MTVHALHVQSIYLTVILYGISLTSNPTSLISELFYFVENIPDEIITSLTRHFKTTFLDNYLIINLLRQNVLVSCELLHR